MQFKSIFFSICILGCSLCLATKDPVLSLLKNGEIVGLSEEYSPALLDIKFSNIKTDPPIQSLTLKLGKNIFKAPKCLVNLIRTNDLNQIVLASSWDHNGKLISYYLDIKFFNPGYIPERWGNEGVSMLFNLRNAKLMEMKSWSVSKDSNSVQYLFIDINKKCKARERNDFKDTFH